MCYEDIAMAGSDPSSCGYRKDIQPASRTSGEAVFEEMVIKVKVVRSRKFVAKTMLSKKMALFRFDDPSLWRYLKYKNTRAVSWSTSGAKSNACLRWDVWYLRS